MLSRSFPKLNHFFLWSDLIDINKQLVPLNGSVSADCVLSFRVEVKAKFFMSLALTYRTDDPLADIYVVTEFLIQSTELPIGTEENEENLKSKYNRLTAITALFNTHE